MLRCAHNQKERPNSQHPMIRLSAQEVIFRIPIQELPLWAVSHPPVAGEVGETHSEEFSILYIFSYINAGRNCSKFES